MLVRALGTAALMTMCIGVAACDEKLSDLTGPTPNLEPTFSTIQRDVFEAPDSSGRPACTNCHTDAGGRVPSAGLNLRSGASYANLVGVASRERPGVARVAPGDPENSYLIHKIEGRPGIVGMRMPFASANFLTQGQILVIKRWIELGAQNN